MRSRTDIAALAYEKLKDAECLFNNGRFDAAYYLAGYFIELLLKARICKTLGIDDFFNFDIKNKFAVKNVENLYKPFKVHNYDQLIILSGLYEEFETESKNNDDFQLHWSVIGKWNENSRYLTGFTSSEVQDFLTSIKEFGSWIKQHIYQN